MCLVPTTTHTKHPQGIRTTEFNSDGDRHRDDGGHVADHDWPE